MIIKDGSVKDGSVKYEFDESTDQIIGSSVDKEYNRSEILRVKKAQPLSKERILKRRRPKPKLKRPENPSYLDYRKGGEGFGWWVEDFICLPVYPEGSAIPIWTRISKMSSKIYPETGRSYVDIWENQKVVARDALQMTDGKFKHRLIVLIWPRGEGKSLMTCLIQLWKFFCFPRQQIMLGANSKDQVKFVHYDIMKDIILNSPKLLQIVGRRNVQEKEVRLRDKKGNIGSFFRSISSFSGIVSNVTGYTFSEMFDMKNPKFFVQLDGSIRNMPNAMGVIDSTVSEKSHILYKLYMTWKRSEDPTLFVSYRCSKGGSYKDFWNPQMTQMQLDSYRAKFPAIEFDRYFRNVWEAGTNRMFTPSLVKATHYLGINATFGCQKQVIHQMDLLLGKKHNVNSNFDEDGAYQKLKETNYERELIPIESIYSLTDGSLHPRMAGLEDLERLSDVYKTDWAILVGVDRADPLKINKMAGARTVVTMIAKGLPNSKNNPEMYIEDGMVKNYIYFLVHLAHIESNELQHIKNTIKTAHDTFDSVQSLCAERWGMWDIVDFCDSNEIQFEPISPTYERQRNAFTELYTLYKTGLFKAPSVKIPGSKEDDILEEEAKLFDSNPFKKWYGSPEKNEKYGTQDDSIFALAWAIYGGRNLGVDDFVERKDIFIFGDMHNNKDLIGNY